MNTDVAIYLTALSFLFFGWITAAVIYGRRYHKHVKLHMELMAQQWETAFDAGQESILESPEIIKEAYTYFFLSN